MAIFVEFIEEIMKVFMDDFFMCGSSFKNCLVNLEKILEMCVKVNLILIWGEMPLHGEGRHSPRTPSVY